jgi:hypothetical protein
MVTLADTVNFRFGQKPNKREAHEKLVARVNEAKAIERRMKGIAKGTVIMSEEAMVADLQRYIQISSEVEHASDKRATNKALFNRTKAEIVANGCFIQRLIEEMHATEQAQATTEARLPSRSGSRIAP